MAAGQDILPTVSLAVRGRRRAASTVREDDVCAADGRREGPGGTTALLDEPVHFPACAVVADDVESPLRSWTR
jgi:hypothetical protein